ncbi:MAG: DUF1559 domain-containing protein [Planctomycetota bacterium]|nr:DUF1559 domain-containing protein [Planctomycetota bacterium]
MPSTKLFLAALLTTSLVLSIPACSQPTVVDAVPRQTGKQPTFHVNEARRKEEQSKTAEWNGAELSFLNSDHFACFHADPGQLLENMRDLDINSEGLQKQLANLIGSGNGKLENLQNVWCILDREFFSVIPDMTGQPTTSPVILILDFATPLNRSELDEQRQQSAAVRSSEQDKSPEANSPETANGPPEIRILSDRRIAMGASAAMDKLSGNGKGATSLIRDLQALPTDAALTGVISISPIRTTLQGVFDLLRNAPGNIGQLVDLPSDLQKLTFKLSLQKPKEFFELAFFLDNPELQSEIFEMVNTALTNSAGTSSSGIPGFPAAGLPLGGMEEGQLVEAESTPLVMELVEQIQQERLLQVRQAPQQLILTMARPPQLTAAVQAVMRDAERQIAAQQRVDRLRKIAAALKQYEKQYGSLPPVDARNQNDGLPAQFSWRVGILPMLGYQELYDRFQFDLPWDHPENLQVAEEIPVEFELEPGTNVSNLHLFCGPGGLHTDRTRGPELDQIKDRKIWNAIVVEGAEKTALPWTQPEALDGPADSLTRFGKEQEEGVLIIDGRFEVRAVRRNLEKIRSVLSVEGGETMKRSDFIKVN